MKNKPHFILHEDLTNISDSMMMDSNTVIAELITPENKKMTLEVRGEVRVDYKDQIYRTPSEFPDELKKLIADTQNWYENENLYISENNWFEVFYENEPDSSLSDTLCEVVDVENCTPDEIYYIMADMINKFESREVISKQVEKDGIDMTISCQMTDIETIAKLEDENDFKEYCNIGELMSLKDFINDCDKGLFTDYDGIGDLCYKHKRISNAKICIDNRQIIISGQSQSIYESPITANVNLAYSIYTLPILYGMDNFEVIWYNK